MRLATLILSLALMLILGFQSCLIAVGGSITKDENTSGGGAVGLLMAFLFLIGAAFVMAFTLVSTIVFGLSGLLGLAVGATTPFKDGTVWGVISLALALMSFLGWRGKVKARKVAKAEAA